MGPALSDRQALLDALVRSDFRAFLQKVFQTVAPGDEFHDNWHLGAIAHRLHRIAANDSNRLVITVPPRSLKSITVSVAWVAWMLGHDPTLRFVCCSYSAELSLKHARDCRLVLQSAWYRRVFSGTSLSRERNAEHDFQTTTLGGRFSTSVGGTLTGRGGDIIIIDDPIKPEDATSELARKSAIEWFGGTLASRLNDKAIRLVQRIEMGAGRHAQRIWKQRLYRLGRAVLRVQLAEYVGEVPFRVRQPQDAPSELAQVLAEALERKRLDARHVAGITGEDADTAARHLLQQDRGVAGHDGVGVELNQRLVQGGDEGGQQPRMQIRFRLVDEQQRALLNEAHDVAEDRHHQPLPGAQRDDGGFPDFIVAGR
jgi:hypothetical protein